MSGLSPIGCTCLAISGCLRAKVRMLSGRSRDEFMFCDLCRSVIHCGHSNHFVQFKQDGKTSLVVRQTIKLTDPGLGSGTFPVYSLHFESCTSMYGPSKTLCTSEKAYWQMADALIFFLKHNPTPQRCVQRTHIGVMIQRRLNTERSKKKLPLRSNFRHIPKHQ